MLLEKRDAIKDALVAGKRWAIAMSCCDILVLAPRPLALRCEALAAEVVEGSGKQSRFVVAKVVRDMWTVGGSQEFKVIGFHLNNEHAKTYLSYEKMFEGFGRDQRIQAADSVWRW